MAASWYGRDFNFQNVWYFGMAHQLYSINRYFFLLISTLIITVVTTNSSLAQNYKGDNPSNKSHSEEVRDYQKRNSKARREGNKPLNKQATKKKKKRAGKINTDIKFSDDARKSVSKDLKKFKPHVKATSPKQKKKANKKKFGNAVEVVVDKDKGKKMNKAAANQKGYVVVEKNPGRKVGREAAQYKGYVVVEKKPGRKVAREAYQYRGYVVVDRSRNRRIARQAANYRPNYIKVKQQLSLTKMYYGKGHGKNAYKYVQKKRFAPHFKNVQQHTTKGKSNSMKQKPLKYTYSKEEIEIWN